MKVYQVKSMLLLWLLLITVPSIAQTPSSPAANSQSSPSAIEQAQALLTAGKLDAAINALLAIPQSASNEAAVNHLLGLAYYQKNDYAKAIAAFALSTKPASPADRSYKQAIQLTGMAHFLLGHIKESIPFLEQVYQWAPDNVEIAYTLGISYLQTHETEKARAAFARMFNVEAGSAAAYLLNAQMMIRQQFEEFAEKELQKALALDPKLPQANFLLGEMAIYKANVELGIELLQKEIAVNPGYAMAYYRLGEAYTRQLKWDQAVAPLQKSIWLNPFFSGPYIVLGKVYLKTATFANAEAMLRRAIQMDPNNYSAHHLLAQTLQQLNRSDEAKKEFELASKLQSSSER